jgi:hypothetical protein
VNYIEKIDVIFFYKPNTMKKLFLIALMAAAAISGCKKDDDKIAYNGDATVSGVKTSFTQMKYFTSESGTTKIYNVFNYGAEDNNMDLSLTNPTVGDNYFSDAINVNVEIGPKLYYSKKSAGKVNISTIKDKTLSGSFSGTFVDFDTKAQVQITGNFSSEEITGFSLK